MIVSFIIPYHNEPIRMVQECISSIAVHSEEIADEREIIVVDDGSKESVKKELASVYPGLIYIEQPNQGLSAARNNALEHATGEYIQFVDSDDKLLPAYRQIISILKDKQPDILQFQLARKENSHTPSANILADCNGAEYLCANNLKASACGYLFRRDVLGNLRFHQGIYHEDELFTPQLFARAEKVIVTDCQAYYYRLRNDSITTSHDERKTRKRLNDMFFVIKSLKALNNIVLQRRIEQLTMDFLYQVATNSHSIRQLLSARKALKNESLYPLPLHTHTIKYYLFALVTKIF